MDMKGLFVPVRPRVDAILAEGLYQPSDGEPLERCFTSLEFGIEWNAVSGLEPVGVRRKEDLAHRTVKRQAPGIFRTFRETALELSRPTALLELSELLRVVHPPHAAYFLVRELRPVRLTQHGLVILRQVGIDMSQISTCSQPVFLEATDVLGLEPLHLHDHGMLFVHFTHLPDLLLWKSGGRFIAMDSENWACGPSGKVSSVHGVNESHV